MGSEEGQPLLCVPAKAINRFKGKAGLGNERVRGAAGIMRGIDSKLDAGKKGYY